MNSCSCEAPVSDLFSGPRAGQENALLGAFNTAAGVGTTAAKDGVYHYLESTPLTSLTVELVQALNKNGFIIVPKNCVRFK